MSIKSIHTFTVYGSSQLDFFSDLQVCISIITQTFIQLHPRSLQSHELEISTVDDVPNNRSRRPRISTTPLEVRYNEGKFSQNSKKPMKMLVVACDSIVSHCQQCVDNNGHRICDEKIDTKYRLLSSPCKYA